MDGGEWLSKFCKQGDLILQSGRSFTFHRKFLFVWFCFIDEKKIFASMCPEVSKALATSKYFVLL